MSVTGVSGNNLFSTFNTSAILQTFQSIEQNFQQLGQDLHSVNMAQAQSDFATLQQNLPGRLQSTLSTTQQRADHLSRHFHHRISSVGEPVEDPQNPVQTLFSELGQSLQAGNLSRAQQA